MAADGELSHRPEIADAVDGPWRRVGENVGVTKKSGASPEELADRLHTAFMDSKGHRENVLGDFNQVGVGVTVTADGKMWATLDFLSGPEGEFPLFGAMDGSVHEDAVGDVWRAGIGRALGLSPAADSGFADASGSEAGWIGAVAEAGVTKGCTEERYCPDQPVTRAQMASFFVRAVPELTEAGSEDFADVDSDSVHAGAIAGLAESGVTNGCATAQYCPGAEIPRAQMASFLDRAFNPAG